MSYDLNSDFIGVCKCFSQCRRMIENVKQRQIVKNYDAEISLIYIGKTALILFNEITYDQK